MDDLLVQRGEEREIMPGIFLSRGSLGATVVKKKGRILGWLHASYGQQWNAYLANGPHGGEHLGRFTQYDAVNIIVEAAGTQVVY